jgi:hypothetical protein
MTDESYDPHARMHESFPRVDSGTKMAGDVIPLAGEKSMGGGPDSSAVDYAAGKKTDPQVIRMPDPQMGNSARRVLQQMSVSSN